jgi:hypothetical protein
MDKLSQEDSGRVAISAVLATRLAFPGEPEDRQVIEWKQEHDGNQPGQFAADFDFYFSKNLKNSQCH